MAENNNENVKKKEISNILTKIPRDWHAITKKVPPTDTKVIIRIVDYDKVRDETEDLILYVEEQKIAIFSEDENNPGVMYWHVCPPYSKYDMSPLTYHDKINENAVITHWADVPEEEIKEYEERFKPQGGYDTLKLEVDKDHEEIVYKALLQGAYLLSASGYSDYYEVFYDLVSLIDTNSYISNGELIERDEGLQHALDIIKEARDILNEDEESVKETLSTVNEIIDSTKHMLPEDNMSEGLKEILSEPPEQCLYSAKHLIEGENKEVVESYKERFENAYGVKFSDIRITDDNLAEKIAEKIIKFSEDTLYTAIGDELEYKIKEFNHEMEIIGSPFRTVLNRDKQSIEIIDSREKSFILDM